MFFDIAWSELALIGAVALVVIGPKDLPKVMRSVGKWTRQARSMAGDFQRHIDDMVRQAELDEIRKEAEAAVKSADMGDIGKSIAEAVDAKGIEAAMRMDEGSPAATPSMLPEGEMAPIPPAPEGLTPGGTPVEVSPKPGEHKPVEESAPAHEPAAAHANAGSAPASSGEFQS